MPETKNEHKLLSQFLKRWLPPVIWVHFTFLFGWLVGYLVLGDRIAPLSALTHLALFFFIPLPLVALAGVWLRDKIVLAGTGIAAVFFFLFWGGLFLPANDQQPITGERLRVISYNALGFQIDPVPVLTLVEKEEADIVFFQELNPAVADALLAEFGDQYPFYVFDALWGVDGMGMMSKYPLFDSGKELPLNWVGVPQVLTLDWAGEEVTLVNFHMYIAGYRPVELFEEHHEYQMAQAVALAELTASSDGPTLAVGDANTTQLSSTYRIMTEGLKDSWLEAGFGFGHTFPSPVWSRTIRLRERGLPSPSWLVRIDYVLYSEPFTAVDAHLVFDGISDHRALVVDLVLEETP